MRTLMRAIVWTGIIAVLVLGGGFLWFTQEVARVEPENARADGIVALTGGANRVADAIALLSQGRARRLLVTGVNPATSRQDIVRLVGTDGRLVECCVDLDYAALNTVGNAVETRRWATAHGFRSLIVVTSAYHMPRTLAELRRRLPGTVLVPYPVTSEAVPIDSWWNHPTTMRLLAAEYAKLILSVARGFVVTEDEAHARGSTI
jgi:uncharacterized SAM-binding protein YcdF (DUF218 family)